jgi:ribosomal subunit interface protein
MKLTITGKHMDIGDSLKDHIETAIKTSVKTLLGDVVEAQVVVSKNNHLFTTDLVVHVSRHFVVRSQHSDEDPYGSYDKALTKMQTQITRYKARLRDQKRVRDDNFSPAKQYVVNNQEDDKGEDNPLIIAEMPHEIPSVNVGEAVMLMDLADSSVMMFKNTLSGHFNVVYRRTDGNVGWIDPTMTNN